MGTRALAAVALLVVVVDFFAFLVFGAFGEPSGPTRAALSRAQELLDVSQEWVGREDLEYREVFSDPGSENWLGGTQDVRVSRRYWYDGDQVARCVTLVETLTAFGVLFDEDPVQCDPESGISGWALARGHLECCGFPVRVSIHVEALTGTGPNALGTVQITLSAPYPSADGFA